MASQQDWRNALNNLPSTPENIPAFFFAHGSPILAFSKSEAASMGEMASYQGSAGPLAQFLADFGSTLLQKYKPKAIVVFSAHWETTTERRGMFSSIYLPCPLFNNGSQSPIIRRRTLS
jgi:aromatic ring-opening dioxygenase catalytic subunit (LigB family)